MLHITETIPLRGRLQLMFFFEGYNVRSEENLRDYSSNDKISLLIIFRGDVQKIVQVAHDLMCFAHMSRQQKQ